MKENFKNLEVCYVNNYTSPIPACCVYTLGYRLTIEPFNDGTLNHQSQSIQHTNLSAYYVVNASVRMRSEVYTVG